MSEVTKDADEAAAELGLVVRRPGPQELFVDLDSLDAYERFDRSRDILKNFIPVTDCVITPSREADHFHAVVTVQTPEPLTARERIMLEMALGSDHIRGVLGLQRIYTGKVKDHSVFFEVP